MESILNQLFWLWAPISLLPDWLRIFVVLFVLLQLARAILFNIVPPFIRLLCLLLKKMLYPSAFPIMALITAMQRNRREAGKLGIPFWVHFVEGMLAFFERFFNKMILLLKKRKRHKKKWSFYAAAALAVLLTAAITNNPNEWYSLKWKNVDGWLTKDKLGKQLGFHRPEWPASSQIPSQKEFILNAFYKNGGNIRSAPTLASPALYTIASGEEVEFMNEEQTDSKGIKWLKVKTVNGQIEGWISSRIVREK